MKKKDLIHYSGAAGIFVIVVLLLLYLANNEVPATNKDLFVSIVGMIVGSLSVVIYAIIGRNPDEVAQLQSKVESLQKHVDMLVQQKDAYEAAMITLQGEIIDKLSLAGTVAFDSIFELKNKTK
jgi:hypothetical protein|tara:strand:- start:339 stop:710 length:372 start_codon:yes stop_codon:yes gene_type:complete